MFQGRRLKMNQRQILETDMLCKNCGKPLVRSRNRWQHKGYQDKVFVCGNPQSTVRWRQQ